jgi:hypothetical protein
VLADHAPVNGPDISADTATRRHAMRTLRQSRDHPPSESSIVYGYFGSRGRAHAKAALQRESRPAMGPRGFN